MDHNAHSRRGWAIFWIGCLGFVLSMFYRVSTTVISPELSKDLHLTTTQLGLLSSAFFYGFALCQVPLGLALDRFGPRLVVTILNTFAVAGALFFALAQNLHQIFWARILMGIGMSCNLMGNMALIAVWFPVNRFATVNGLFAGIGVLGNLLAATPLAFLAHTLGWRKSFLLFAGFNALQVLCFFLIVRDRPQGDQRDNPSLGNPFKGMKQVIRFPYYWIISIGTFFRYGSLMALQGLWAGPYLMNGLGVDILTTGNALLVMGVGYMIGLPLFGRISDYWIRSRKKVVLPSLWVTALLILSLAFLPRGINIAWIYLWFLAMGLASAPGQIMYSHIKELVPSQVMATSMTGVNLFTMLGAAFLMQAMGLMVEAGPQGLNQPEAFRPAWYLCVVGLGVSGILYSFIPDSQVLKK
ncbi:MAG: thiamine biosynthesis protein ThiF [Desulfobacca sp.]|nr:thiamine biosynthesis protein ThiF [Desulfobacca sp.]